jgi:F-type H+-transporting ATPase subunit delta
VAQLSNRLSNRYATAIFDLSVEKGVLNDNLDQAIFLRDVLSEDDTQSVITHPRISAAKKQSFFDEAFSGKVSNELLGFLHLAVTKNREEFIVPVLGSFIDMANDYVRKTTALVTCAVPLKPEQITALAALLSKKLSKQVEIEQRVDPSVIGGLHIQVDGYYIDRTVKTRLQEISDSLSKGGGK